MMNKKDFINICKLSQSALKKTLQSILTDIYPEVIFEDGYLYAKGTDPICLTAHLDTVHKETVRKVTERKGKISSLQGIGGDDRCGVYMILKILSTTNLRPTILFCEDEEIGGKGSQKFVKSKYIKDLENMLFLIELDRANAKDLVFYEDINYDFHDFCEKATGYKTSYGSFSDISNLCPACKVSGVNISCGYYNAHTTSEYVVMDEMENSIKQTIELMNKGIEKGEQYEYEEDDSYIYGYGFGYDDYFGRSKHRKDDLLINVIFYDTEGGEYFYSNVDGVMDAIAQLLTDNPTLCWNDIIDYYIC